MKLPEGVDILDVVIRCMLKVRIPVDIKDCHIWTGAKTSHGYGHFGFNRGPTIAAHRFIFELAYGPIPSGMDLLHHCDNRACVNPMHLTYGTRRSNLVDMVRKGRSNWGERHRDVKLTVNKVLDARIAYFSKGTKHKTIHALARENGVALSTMREAIHGKTWTHVSMLMPKGE